MKAEHFKKVQEIANNISSCIKSLKLYQPGHKTIDEMVSRLFGFFSFLEEIKMLEFEIDSEGLKWEGRILLSAKEAEQDFLFRLYKDGIRLIVFHQGLKKEELMRFLELFNKSIQRDQDISTLFWEENFQSIKFSQVEAFHSFFKRDTLEEEKYLENEVLKWISKMKEKDLFSPIDIKVKEEECENFETRLEPLDFKEFENAKENAMQILISNLLKSLNSENIEVVQNSAINLRLLEKILLESADLEILTELINLLDENSSIKEVRELKKHLLSEDTLRNLVSSLFLKEIPSLKSLGFFLNVLNDDVAPYFLYFIFERKKETLKPLYFNLSIFRPNVLVKFLNLIEKKDGLEILNSFKSFSDEMKFEIFKSNNIFYQMEVLKKLEKPNKEIIEIALKSQDKDLRILSLKLILRFKLEEFLDYLVEEILKENFLKKDFEEKEKWINTTAILGKNKLEPFFLSFFERKSTILNPSIEEQKIFSSKALKILGTEKALPYLEREVRKFSSSPKLRKFCKKAIEEIKRRKNIK